MNAGHPDVGLGNSRRDASLVEPLQIIDAQAAPKRRGGGVQVWIGKEFELKAAAR
eukprot:gene11090-14885_t